MNKYIVKYVIGTILKIEGILLFAPFVVSLIYQESFIHLSSWVITALLTYGVGYSLSHKEVSLKDMYAKEGFIIVAFSWILMSFFGSLPFIINGDIPSLIDAFFETSSGFTTTGASILTNVETLSHSSLFWRSFTHLLGGMGVLVFALAILPRTESESVHIMKAEVPGPTFGKLVSKLSSSAQILYIIYLSMTAITILFLLLGGLPLFDSVLLSFGAAGTGGFGVLNGSIAPYDSLYVEVVLGVAMILFGVNFNLYFLAANKQIKEALDSEELKWLFGIIGTGIVFITANLVLNSYELGSALRDSFFSVASIITTTGFATTNFGEWPLFSQIVILMIMFVGGMAGSTAGGLKVSRIAIIIKSAISEIKRISYPNRVVPTHFEKKPLHSDTKKSVLHYLTVYIMVFVIALLILSLETSDFLTNFSSVVATLNNIGPGLGQVGPNGNFSMYSPFIKVILSFVMIMGRLEIFPILILFNPNMWRKKA